MSVPHLLRLPGFHSLLVVMPRAKDSAVRDLSTRLATPDDAAIAAIYNEGIADRIATFETEPRTVEQIAAQLRDKGDRFPTIVAEHDGRIVAWAGAGPYRARPAYAGVAEHSVYVARSARGKGAGRVVLDAFLPRLRRPRLLENRVTHLPG
jgi:L-amino acid N-acyltransferase YncA